MKIIYNKAVRDRIPEIIERDGKKPIIVALDDDEFLKELEKKLREEIDEYLRSKKIDELVDIEEVILRIIELRKVTGDNFTAMRIEKKREKGGFDSNLYLKEVDDQNTEQTTPDLLEERRKAIGYWSKKYESDHPWWVEREAILGDILRRDSFFDKQFLRDVVEWKFYTLPGRKKRVLGLVDENSEERVMRVSTNALREGLSDRLRVKELDSLVGVGPAVTSTILTFWNPDRYCVLDIHVWREVFGEVPNTLFTSISHYITLLDGLRNEATKYGYNIRTVEKALFKKNLDESKS